MLLNWIEKAYPDSYTFFQPQQTTDILILLERNHFDIFEKRAELNQDGFLLPFSNGVLNCKTREFVPHAKELFSTHKIGVNYEPGSAATLNNTPMANFLANIVNHSSNGLNVLRACLYLIFNNKLNYQVALYIYGPGGTGKTTLTNMLIFLFGPSASLSTNIQVIKNRFGTDLLRNKLLLVINELPHLTGPEPTLLKSIVGRETLIGEKKYLTPTQFIPTAFIVITCNALWNLKDATSAMGRRFIYFEFKNRPVIRNNELFNLASNGKATGELVNYLPAFVNWALNCPEEYVKDIAEGADSVTAKLNPDSLIRTEPIKV